jgi:hypothetical protein
MLLRVEYEVKRLNSSSWRPDGASIELLRHLFEEQRYDAEVDVRSENSLQQFWISAERDMRGAALLSFTRRRMSGVQWCLMFRGSDAKDHSTLLILQGTMAQGENEQQCVLTPTGLLLFYIVDAKAPDVYRLPAGSF